MKVYFKYFIVMVVALATTILSACTPSGGNDTPGGDNGGGNTPEAPAVIPNNGVGEDGVIALDSNYGGIYFGQFWKKHTGEEWANYYVILTNDEVGVTTNGDPVPMHQGGWVLFLDFWGVVSTNHADPILPEGKYDLAFNRGWSVLDGGTTLATNNVEQVYDEESNSYKYRINDITFISGSTTVSHTSKGYLLEAEFVAADGKTLKFRYEGRIIFDDKSDDEEWSVALDEDVEFKPFQGWTYLSSQKDNCDKHLIYLFDVTKLTDDHLHPGVVGGMKLQLTVYTEKGASLAGSYVAGEQTPNGFTLVEEKPGLYYPGCYWGTTALGSFIEYAKSESEILYSIIESGTINIAVNSDGTHTIVVDGVSDKGKKITCNWTGVLSPRPETNE